MHRSLLRNRFERIGLAIGISLAVFIILAVMNMVLQSDQGPLEPTPQPSPEPTIGPTVPATPATPEITFDPEPPPPEGSLLFMLEYAPDRLQDNSLPLSDIARYANIEVWMDVQGIETPTNPNDTSWDAWRQQLSALSIPEVFAARGTDDIWISTYGFGLHQVDQILAVGSAPDFVVVMRGDFDEEELLAAWADSGYQAVRVDGVTYWSLNPGGSVDLSAPASRPALGNMNNLVLLDDGTLIATSRSARLEQAISAARGNSPNLADNADIRALLSSGIEPHRLVTAILLKGTVLEELTIPSPGAEIATPVPELPQAKLMLAGLHVQPEAEIRTTMMIVAVYDSAADATFAQRRVQTMLAQDSSRITGMPYSDRLQPVATRVISTRDNQQLLLMHLKLVDGSADWLEIIEQRDLGFLMWPRVP